jgi:hypothetical protein
LLFIRARQYNARVMFENYFLNVMHWQVGSVQSYWLIAIHNQSQRPRKLAKFQSLDALLKAFQDTEYIGNDIIEQARTALTNATPFVIHEIALSDKELNILGLAVWE